MEAEEFKIEVLPVKNKIYRFARRLLHDPEEAKDTVQEVFLRLWTRRNKLNNYRSIEAFAMIITKNLCFDKLKAKRSSNLMIQEQELTGDDISPYVTVEKSDEISRVKEIIDHLPETQKIIIHLRDIEGLEYDEISEIMGMSPNNIRVTLSRARKKVRDVIIKLQNYEFSNN